LTTREARLIDKDLGVVLSNGKLQSADVIRSAPARLSLLTAQEQ